MLNPHSRRHLIDALRPPAGYKLDYAIGTTYSLDLIALLTAPLAFTFFDWEADGTRGLPTADPLALLEALRRHADRITIFCDAGRIAIPSDSQQMFAYLECSVIEARAPRGGAFHPKVWVLRFTGTDGTIAYRVLCLSRNLTFDRCWDTMLALDGMLPPNGPVLSNNAPLCAFVAALPAMSVRQNVQESVQEQINQMARELARVPFDVPAGFDMLTFHPLGIADAPLWPFGSHYDRMLVISPFISAGRLGKLGWLGQNNILISRLEELQEFTASALQSYQRIFTLSPESSPEDADTADSDPAQSALVGLHAKLFVADHGDRAHIWTGSANATDAAFTSNVEFLVELTGPGQQCGIEAVLGENRDDGPLGLIALLQPFDPNQPPVLVEPVQQALDDLVEHIRQQIARLDLTAHVTPSTADDVYNIALRLAEGSGFALPADVSVMCWPITRTSLSALPLDPNESTLIDFRDLSFEALTSFYAISVEAMRGVVRSRCAFVLNVPLIGAPENRRERILRTLLKSRDQVLRFLLLLLADDNETLSSLIAETSRGPGQANANGQSLFGIPLFEAMVRALDRDPAKLEHIARIVEDLRRTPEGQQLLPETFDSIWVPIQAAYAGVKI